MKKMFFRFCLLLLMSLCLNFISAQTTYVITKGTVFSVSGSSSLGDWDMATKNAQGSGTFHFVNNHLVNVSTASVSTKAETLKSGKRGLDRNAYHSLRTHQYKHITFTLSELTGSSPNFTARGTFTIGGVSRPATFPVRFSQNGQLLVFEGRFDTRLSDFSIEPPTALMGTVRTRDEVSIHFKAIFKPTN